MSPGQDIRLGLTLQYDGSGFHGWQAQEDARTVQGEVEAVTERLTGRKVRVLASGRTDSGVHAKGQVVALDVPPPWTPMEFRRAANAVLPRDIWVNAARQMRPDFNPRYHAVSRTYVYRIGLAEDAWSPFFRPWCWPIRASLERTLLDRAAEQLAGRHSFRAFAKTGGPQRSQDCEVYGTQWRAWDDKGLAYTITANRYLHHMVRYLVGTMVAIARGARDLEDIAELLEQPASDLTTSPPAPPQGLFLERVSYPDSVWVSGS